mmetsp:Transcript_894/g.4054  ORF Transcript_894/g.4054 Transcript_894/m.4054 type:complete len:308 (-) Transcript_894:2464-3387(-)
MTWVGPTWTRSRRWRAGSTTRSRSTSPVRPRPMKMNPPRRRTRSTRGTIRAIGRRWDRARLASSPLGLRARASGEPRRSWATTAARAVTLTTASRRTTRRCPGSDGRSRRVTSNIIIIYSSIERAFTLTREYPLRRQPRRIPARPRQTPSRTPSPARDPPASPRVPPASPPPPRAPPSTSPRPQTRAPPATNPVPRTPHPRRRAAQTRIRYPPRQPQTSACGSRTATRTGQTRSSPEGPCPGRRPHRTPPPRVPERCPRARDRSGSGPAPVASAGSPTSAPACRYQRTAPRCNPRPAREAASTESNP